MEVGKPETKERYKIGIVEMLLELWQEKRKRRLSPSLQWLVNSINTIFIQNVYKLRDAVPTATTKYACLV